MRSVYFIPVAVLALAVACTESSPNPVESSNRPSFSSGGNTGNPKYSSSVYSLTNALGLNHSWRQTGLGSFTNVPYLLTADADITAHCENKSGNTVNGQPFHVSQSLSSGPTTFPQRNGAINGSISLTPSAVDCQPPGGNPHAAIIDAVVYSSIRFCWGKSSPSVADLQGPVPGGPGNGGTVPPSPQNGTPLDGSEATDAGIFGGCTST
jgi:hypothetical protein